MVSEMLSAPSVLWAKEGRVLGLVKPIGESKPYLFTLTDGRVHRLASVNSVEDARELEALLWFLLRREA